MRYDTPIYFQKLTPGEYDPATGNYGEDAISEDMKSASVMDTGTNTMMLVYSGIKEDHDATALAFTTENERTKSKDADSTVTKDGTVRTPGAAEGEITASSLLKKGDEFIDELEAALDDDEKMEIWEVNLAEPQASSTDKFKAKYFQGYLTEIDKTSNAEDNVELSLTFGLEGKGVDGYATVTAEQQEVAAYVFADTQKTGA